MDEDFLDLQYLPIDRLPLSQTLQDGHLARVQLLHQPHCVHRAEESAWTPGA